MLCDTCQSIFQESQTLESLDWHEHHGSSHGVYMSARSGCRVCLQLWKQDTRIERKATEYSISAIEDEVDTQWSKWETGPPSEALNSSETWYELVLRWQGSFSWPNDTVRYHLRESSGAFVSPYVFSGG